MDEGNDIILEQSGEADSQPSQVEVTEVDYSDTLQVIVDQQQVMIGVSAMLLGAVLIAAMFTVFSRFF